MGDQKEIKRIDYLDYMRIFAFLNVLVGHLFNEEIAVLASDHSLHVIVRTVCQVIYDVCYAGAAGVVVFFFTSGYIIAHVIQSETAGEFMVRRIFRIYPLYVIAVLSELLVTNTVTGDPVPPVAELIPRLLLLGDFFGTPFALGGVDWTLRVEIMFYLFMAVLKGVGAIDRPNTLPWIISAASLCLFLAGPFPNWSVWTNGYLNMFGPFLFIGVLVYIFEKRLANRYFCAAIILSCYFLSVTKTAQYKVTLSESHFALLALVLFVGAWFFRESIRGNAVTRMLSEMTYSVYLLHLWSWSYLEILAVKFGLEGGSAKVFKIVVLFAICYGVTITVERGGIRLGKHVIFTFSRYLRPGRVHPTPH